MRKLNNWKLVNLIGAVLAILMFLGIVLMFQFTLLSGPQSRPMKNPENFVLSGLEKFYVDGDSVFVNTVSDYAVTLTSPDNEPIVAQPDARVEQWPSRFVISKTALSKGWWSMSSETPTRTGVYVTLTSSGPATIILEDLPARGRLVGTIYIWVVFFGVTCGVLWIGFFGPMYRSWRKRRRPRAIAQEQAADME